MKDQLRCTTGADPIISKKGGELEKVINASPKKKQRRRLAWLAVKAKPPVPEVRMINRKTDEKPTPPQTEYNSSPLKEGIIDAEEHAEMSQGEEARRKTTN